MPDDSYHTMGAAKDRARTWHLAAEQNKLLERIAVALEKLVDDKEKKD